MDPRAQTHPDLVGLRLRSGPHPTGKLTMLTSFLVIGCLLAGEPASDAALKTEVSRLVHKLDADTQKERAGGRKTT